MQDEHQITIVEKAILEQYGPKVMASIPHLSEMINRQNRKRLTPLLIALQQHNTTCAQFLLSRGATATPDIIDELGMTALHHAVIMQSLPLVTSILQAGCDPLTQDFVGNTALHYAAAGSKHISMALLRQEEWHSSMLTINKKGQRPCDMPGTITKWLQTATQKQEEKTTQRKTQQIALSHKK